MASNNKWEDDPESGVTPGPEEALQKEIEKSKLLKLERLQLRDKLEKLKEENQYLLKENQILREKLQAVAPEEIQGSSSAFEKEDKTDARNSNIATLTWLAMAILFAMITWLFYFFLTA